MGRLLRNVPDEMARVSFFFILWVFLVRAPRDKLSGVDYCTVCG